MEKLAKVKVGDYYLADGSFTDNSTSKDVIGVVAWVNAKRQAAIGNKVLVLLCKEEVVQWSETFCDCKSADVANGEKNTRRLLHCVQRQNLVSGLAEFCLRMRQSLKGCFIPSAYQWMHIVENWEKVNGALQRAGKPPLEGRYWSSTEYDVTTVWILDAFSAKESLYCGDYLWKGKRAGSRMALAF